MRYNKLVRDGIPEIIRQSGKKPVYRTLTDSEEKRKAICAKVVEEAKELAKARNVHEAVTELADLKEIIEAYIEEFGIPRLHIGRMRQERARTRGRFTKKIFLISDEGQ